MLREHDDTAAPFLWTVARRQAAELVAQDRLTDEEIAQTVGVGRRTLVRWKGHPTFLAKVDQILEQADRTLGRCGLAQRRQRLQHLQDRHRRLQALIAERAELGRQHNERAREILRRREAGEDVPQFCTEVVPGLESGLLMLRRKVIGGGKDALRLDEYTLDVGLLREMREIEAQAAQEVGQWMDRHDYGFSVDVKSLSDDELERIARGEALPHLLQRRVQRRAPVSED